MAEIKGVFFDLGGTLRVLEAAPEHQAAARARMAQLAEAADPQELLALIDSRYEVYRDWALTENKESGDYELWDKWLLPELPEEKLKSICHEMTYQYRQVKGRRRLVDGGLEVIQTLRARGYQLAIISNLIGEDEIPAWLQADGLTEYFGAVILSSVCHIRKPDQAIYQMACDQLGLKPEECVSVADNLKRDITGAKAAGVGANILYISPEKLAQKTITDENRPDYIVHRFLDILELPVWQ